MFKLLHSVLKIDRREVEFARRGFLCSRSALRERLEHVGSIFLDGYHFALQQTDLVRLADQLNQTDMEDRGFAYEGAAMALTLLDAILPWRRKVFPRFVAGPGRKHIYMVYIGAGWAYARLPWLRPRIESVIAGFHPVLRWLVIDGYGFHEGFFHWQTPLRWKIEAKMKALSVDSRHVFYQGLGRSLWFVHGADRQQIEHTISGFGPEFRGDAWSGVGLACAYAGGLDKNEMEELLWHAGQHRPALAQGAAFAAKARQLADNRAAHTELACNQLCSMSADSASEFCDETLLQLNPLHSCPYQQWRELLQKEFSLHKVFDRQSAWVS